MLKDYFLSSQDWRSDSPYKQVTIDEARKLKAAGTHYFVNHGQAIAEIPGIRIEAGEIVTKSKWMPRPSGTLQIGFVNVLQLV